MDKNVPPFGMDLFKAPRNYITVALFAVAQFLSTPYTKAYQDRLLSGR
jgi:hypothetical protein